MLHKGKERFTAQEQKESCILNKQQRDNVEKGTPLLHRGENRPGKTGAKPELAQEDKDGLAGLAGEARGGTLEAFGEVAWRFLPCELLLQEGNLGDLGCPC